MKMYSNLKKTDRERRKLRGGFTLGQEHLQNEVIPSEEDDEYWNINHEIEESSYNDVVYDGETFHNKTYNKTRTATYARSTIESPNAPFKTSKTRKSDRKLQVDEKSDPKLKLPLDESTSFKGRSSKHIIPVEEEQVEFEIDSKEEIQRLQSKKTQEFSVAMANSESARKILPPDFSPHASYPKAPGNDKRLSFAMHLTKVDDPSETHKPPSVNSPELPSPAKTSLTVPVKPNSSRKHRPSVLHMFNGDKEDDKQRLRDEKERELERSKGDQEFIKQISREVRIDKANRERKKSILETSQVQEARSQQDNLSRRDIQDDGLSVTKPERDSNTIIFEKSPMINLQRGSNVNSTYQNGMFDSSMMAQSPILPKSSPQQGQTTLKLLEVMNAVSSRDIPDEGNFEPRSSANFGTLNTAPDYSAQKINNKASNTNIQMSPTRLAGISQMTNTSIQVKEVLGGLKKKSMVEYLVKNEQSGSFMLRDLDMQAVAGLGAASWRKFDRLKNTLHLLFPDYSLDMHATIDVDTLIDIVAREFGKLKNQVADLNSKLGLVSSEKENHKKKLTELETMMKTLLEKIEYSEDLRGGNYFGKTSPMFLTPQAIKSNQMSPLKNDLKGKSLYRTGNANPTFGNMEEVNMMDSSKLVSNLQINLDYARNELTNQTNNLRIAINGDRSGKLSEKRIMSVDLKERQADRLLNAEMSSYQHFSDNREATRPAVYLVDRTETGETLQIDNASIDQLSVDHDAPITDLFGSEFETHFTYRQEKGRFTLRKNSSSHSRGGECSCSARCFEHKDHAERKCRVLEEKQVDLVKKEIKLGPKNPKKSILEERRSKEHFYKKNILELTKEATGQNSKHYFPKMDKSTYSLSARDKIKPSANLAGRYDGMKEVLKTPRSVKLCKGKFIALKTSSSNQNIIN